MQQDQRRRLTKLLWIEERTKEVGVVQACKEAGIGKQTYYDWKNRYQAEGVEGLKSKSKAPIIKRTRSKYLREKIKDLSIEYPTLSTRKLSDLLKERGVSVSPSTVGNYWKDLGLAGVKSRFQKAEEALLSPGSKLPFSTKKLIIRNNGFILDRKINQRIQIHICWKEVMGKRLYFYIATEASCGISAVNVSFTDLFFEDKNRIMQLVSDILQICKYSRKSINISIKSTNYTENIDSEMNSRQHIYHFRCYFSERYDETAVSKFVNESNIIHDARKAILAGKGLEPFLKSELGKWNYCSKPFFPFCGKSPMNLRNTLNL